MCQKYRIERLDFSNPIDMQRLVDLQNVVYKGKHVFTETAFRHWYLDNPNGRVISFNAIYNNIIAAHYAVVPVKMKINNRIVIGLLSMATVTHPKHRGQGLFKKLAQLSYDYAIQNGYEFVIGVANANSYPGFVKYFDFQDVGNLEVLVGHREAIKENSQSIFKFFWDQDSIKWRLGGGKYVKDKTSVFGTKPLWIFKKAPFIYTYMGSVNNDLIDILDIPKAHSFWRPFKLYVGMGSNARNLGYYDIPKFIKRSPFHLIFMDLTGGKLPKMTKDNVFFQLMDFDVA